LRGSQIVPRLSGAILLAVAHSYDEYLVLLVRYVFTVVNM